MFFLGVNSGRKLANETADLLKIPRNLFDTALLEHKITWNSLKPFANNGLTSAELASQLLGPLESGLDLLAKKFGPQAEISEAKIKLSLYSWVEKRAKSNAVAELLTLVEILKKSEKPLQEDVKLSAFISMLPKIYEGIDVLEAIVISYVWAVFNNDLTDAIVASEISTSQAQINVICKSLISKSLLFDYGQKDGNLSIRLTPIGETAGRRIALNWLTVVENAERGV